MDTFGWVTLSPTRPVSNGTNGQGNSVVLGPRDRLVGELYIEGDLQVSGTVDGTLEATGNIEIAGTGKVSGTVTAYNRLVVGSDASLIGGEVRVARLTVEDGATFTGKVSMGKHAVESPKPIEPEPTSPRLEVVPVVEPAIEPTPSVKPVQPIKSAKPSPQPVPQKGKRR